MTAWRKGMRQLAEQKNVVTKLSAFGTFIHRNDPDHVASLVKETVKVFGADRCLFGSNFPIEKIWTDYASLIAAFKAATKGMKAEARQQIFHDNAARVYRL